MMSGENSVSHLSIAMSLLGLNAKQLSVLCGVSNSLISRWQRGARPLTTRSEALVPLVETLLALDSNSSKLDEPLAYYLACGAGKREALIRYLTEEKLPALPARATPLEVQHRGSYVIQQQVLLGAAGFRRSSLLMLDYIMKLPPGQQMLFCAHNGFDLWHGNLPFALQALFKLNQVLKRETTILLINRKSAGLHGSPWFSVFWLTIHLKGIIRSRYYEGDPPEEIFVGVIPGYWSGRCKHDDTAEDGLIATLYTDPRNVGRDEAHVSHYMEKSVEASQYGFLRSPAGNEQSRPLWRPGSLPKWDVPDAVSPEGNFFAICRVPSFGVMTQEEFASVEGENAPPLPNYLFSSSETFAAGPHRLILCRDDVREGLQKARRKNEPLSELLGRTAYISSTMLAAQLQRLLAAMETNEDFEVALMPRSAFKKLELELIHWRNSAGLCWLQNMNESLFDCNPVIADSFTEAVEHTWGRLQKAWKRKPLIMRTLRKWLAGKELNAREEDSVIVKNWELLPKE